LQSLSLLHNKETKVIGCSAHQTRTEFICSLHRWKILASIPFVTVWHTKCQPTKKCLLCKEEKDNVIAKARSKAQFCLMLEKKPYPFFVVEQCIHVYLNEKMWCGGKKEIFILILLVKIIIMPSWWIKFLTTFDSLCMQKIHNRLYSG